MKRITVLTAAILFSGTAWAQSPCATVAENVQKSGNDTAKTAAAGAVIGGIAGGLFGKKKNSNQTAKNAALGAVIGGVAGAAIGQVASNRRHTYQTEAAYLECEIGETNRQIADRQQKINAGRAQLSSYKNQADTLRGQHATGQANLDDIRTLRAILQSIVSDYEMTMTSMDTEIQYLQSVVDSATPMQNEDVASLEARKTELTNQVASLRTQYQTMAGLRNDTQIVMASLPSST